MAGFAQMPFDPSPAAAAASVVVRSAVSNDPWTSLTTAARIRIRVFGDSSSASPYPIGGARSGWTRKNSRLTISRSRVFAVSPRSRAKWLLLHNLPDTLDKKVSEKEDVQDDAVAGDLPKEREAEIELLKSSAERRENARRAESFRESKGSNLGHATETGETLGPSHKQNAREAWLVVERSQPRGHQSFRKTDGDLESGKFKKRGQEQENKGTYAAEITERGDRRKPYDEEFHTVRDIGSNAGPVEIYQQRGPQVLQGMDGDPETRQVFESKPKRESKSRLEARKKRGGMLEPSEGSVSLREEWRNAVAVERYQARGPQVGTDTEFSESRPSKNKKVMNPGVTLEASLGLESTASKTTERGQRVVEGFNNLGSESLFKSGGYLENGIAGESLQEEEESPAVEINAGERTGKRELVDYNGEKVIEVWRKGRVVKRYKPLGMEFLYGRTKPTRLYGPLNSRGEAPGCDLAPVPRRYRDRCEHQQGWSVKEVVTKILELNHWDDIDVILNQWVGRYNRKNFPPLMTAMTRTGALKHSARMFTWMKNQRCYRARNDIYNLMIWLYARHNQVDRARSLFSEMQEWRCKPDLETYNAMINVHGRVRQWRESLLFFDRLLRAAVPPSTGTYNNLINACGSSGQWQKALGLYQRMKDDGVEMDVVTHNTVLTALKIGGQYHMAIEHFEQILQWKVRPDAVTLNVIISCFSKMERYDEAVQLFNSMRRLKWDGCIPNLVTFTTVMHVYAACGQVANVKAIFDLMVGEGVVPNIVSYNTLIGAYASVGLDVEAQEVFESMQKVGFEPDIVSYTALMNAYSKSRKPDDAAGVFELMKRRSRKPNIVTYNTLIHAYGTGGRVKEALRLLPDMDFDEIPPTVVTICSLIVACGRSGEIERVSGVLRIAALRKIRLNVNVYNTALSVYLNRGMSEEADKLYTTMKEEGVSPDAITFTVLINGAAKVGNISQARRHFDVMLSLGIGISVEACSALIHAYADQGLPGDAQAMLTTMKESGCAPNVITYTSLIHAYSTAEMPEAAMAVFEEMEIMGVQLDDVACSALFTAFNHCGQMQKALLLWSKWREHIQFGTAAYTELSKSCSLLRDWVMALELLEEMQQVGVKPDSTIGNNVLRSLSRNGKGQLLTKVFSALQELGMMTTKDTYNILIDGYSRTQNWRECLEILDRFKADGLHPELATYKMVLKCLANVQVWDKYLEIYNQMMIMGFQLQTSSPRSSQLGTRAIAGVH